MVWLKELPTGTGGDSFAIEEEEEGMLMGRDTLPCAFNPFPFVLFVPFLNECDAHPFMFDALPFVLDVPCVFDKPRWFDSLKKDA